MTAFFTERRIAALLLIGSFAVFLVVGYLFTARVIWEQPFAQTTRHLRIERGMVIAAFLISLHGFVMLEGLLRETGGAILARLALAIYVICAAVLVVAETTYLDTGLSVYPQLVAHVVLAFLAQAAFGAALLQGRIAPAWAGWAAILWNLGLLVIMPAAFPRDMYFPWLHYIAPLLIGIALLVKRQP